MSVQRVALGVALWVLAAILIVAVVATDVSSRPGVAEPVMVTIALFSIIGGLQLVRGKARGRAQ